MKIPFRFVYSILLEKKILRSRAKHFVFYSTLNSKGKSITNDIPYFDRNVLKITPKVFTFETKRDRIHPGLRIL